MVKRKKKKRKSKRVEPKKKENNLGLYSLLTLILIICIIGFIYGVPEFVNYLTNNADFIEENFIWFCGSLIVLVILFIAWLLGLYNWELKFDFSRFISSWVITIILLIAFLLGIFAIIKFLLYYP